MDEKKRQSCKTNQVSTTHGHEDHGKQDSYDVNDERRKKIFVGIRHLVDGENAAETEVVLKTPVC